MLRAVDRREGERGPVQVECTLGVPLTEKNGTTAGLDRRSAGPGALNPSLLDLASAAQPDPGAPQGLQVVTGWALYRGAGISTSVDGMGWALAHRFNSVVA